MNAFEIAAVGLQHDTDRLRTIAQNVANATTGGYRRQVAVQQSFASAMEAVRNMTEGLATHTVTTPGALRATSQPLDVALAANEFLVIQLPGGELALTRNGRLSVDAASRLVTGDGALVQGASGPITVPRGTQSVRIDGTGAVLADDTVIGSLAIVSRTGGQPLHALGGGAYRLDDQADVAQVRAPSVRAGYLEGSNVVSAHEMLQLMSTVRHAESMARLMQGADDALGSAIRKFGETS